MDTLPAALVFLVRACAAWRVCTRVRVNVERMEEGGEVSGQEGSGDGRASEGGDSREADDDRSGDERLAVAWAWQVATASARAAATDGDDAEYLMYTARAAFSSSLAVSSASLSFSLAAAAFSPEEQSSAGRIWRSAALGLLQLSLAFSWLSHIFVPRRLRPRTAPSYPSNVPPPPTVLPPARGRICELPHRFGYVLVLSHGPFPRIYALHGRVRALSPRRKDDVLEGLMRKSDTAPRGFTCLFTRLSSCGATVGGYVPSPRTPTFA